MNGPREDNAIRGVVFGILIEIVAVLAFAVAVAVVIALT